MIVYNNAAHGAAIAEKARCQFNPADVVISREKDGRLVGGSIFQDYTGASIAIHVAGFEPHWMNRELMFATFYYPFGQLGCRNLFGYVPSNNPHALEYDLKLGFKEVARIPGVFWDADIIVLCMDAEDCRWIKPANERPSNG